MHADYWIAVVSAAWLGVLTSVSPCPLATNIAAITYISRHMTGRGAGRVLLAGFAYALGRMLIYLALGLIIVAGALSVPGLSFFLQKYINLALGPLLIIVGMFLLELLSLNLGRGEWVSRLQTKIPIDTASGPFLLGLLFALALCPVSAALFFGSLIPLAITHASHVLMPAMYGIGTAVPVVFFAVLIGLGARSLTKVFSRVTTFEGIARRVTGVVFILVGIYLTLKYVFNVT